jgi:hypothetical protein
MAITIYNYNSHLTNFTTTKSFGIIPETYSWGSMHLKGETHKMMDHPHISTLDY